MKTTPNLIKRLAMLPVWVLALLTSAKSFRDNPVIGSKRLNKAGLHIVRVLLARAVTCLRWAYLSPLMAKEERHQFHKDGYLIVPDFISAEIISMIRAEVSAHQGDVRQMTQGDTATQRILLDKTAFSGKPTLANFAKTKGFQARLRYAAAHAAPPLLYVQRIRNGQHTGKADPQKTMHADTFHPTMKAWLFLEDVTPAKGPFTYVTGSNQLTWKRLKWEHQRSITARDNPDGYSEKGSFRAGPDDLSAMGLPKPTGICAKAGTLVIANTNGFHGRGQAEAGASRLEVWAYARPSPFNPLPGIPFAFWNGVQTSVLKAFWRHKDKVAARKNSKASWHLIPPEHMTDFGEISTENNTK